MIRQILWIYASMIILTVLGLIFDYIDERLPFTTVLFILLCFFIEKQINRLF